MEKKSKMNITDIQNKTIEKDDIKLLLLTRDSKKSIYIYDIDIDDSLRDFFYNNKVALLEKHKNTEIKKYDYIYNEEGFVLELSADDIENLDFSNKFSNMLERKTKFIGLSSIKDKKQKLFAYCIKYYDRSSNDSFYSFTKIQPSKISSDEKRNSLRAKFSTNGAKLTEYKDETISFNQNIDFILYKNTYLIFNKAMFEQIVDIAKHIEKKSNDAINQIKTAATIEGVNYLEDFAKGNTLLQRRIIKINQIGIFRSLDKEKLEKISKVGKKYNIKVTIENNKLIIHNTREDVENVCKLLCDYFKKGEITGDPYGTYGGDNLKH